MIKNQTHQELKTALIRLALFYKSEDGIIVRIDNARGFLPLKQDPTLKEYNITLDFGEEKNENHNPVAEKAIRELEEIIVKLLPRGGEVTEIVLSKATEVLNKIIRHSGYNAQELLTNQDQSTGAKLDLPDSKLSELQWKMRTDSHLPSAKYESRDAKPPDIPKLSKGDIVFVKNERSKHKAREKYFVVNIIDDEKKVEIQKITDKQIRAKRYKVKPEAVMLVKHYEDTNLERSTEEEFYSAEEEINDEDTKTCDQEKTIQSNLETNRPRKVMSPDLKRNILVKKGYRASIA